MVRNILFLCLLICFPATAQHNYIQYHREIILAEELILSTQMKESLVQFRTTFEHYPKTFARDAFLAFQIACMVKDTAAMVYFFDKAVSNGVPWEPFRHSMYYVRMVEHDRTFQKRLITLYSEAEARYLSKIDTIQRNFVQRLSKLDNDTRVKKNPREDMDSASLVIWLKVMDNNSRSLDSFMRIHGFPGEHVAGVNFFGAADYPGEHPAEAGSFTLHLSPTPTRIFLHGYCGLFLSEDILWKAIKEGELSPKEFALIYEWTWYSWQRKSNWWDKYYKYQCIPPKEKTKFYNYYTFHDYYSNDIPFVNRCRAEIGMYSVDHEQKLRTFGRKNGVCVTSGWQGNY